MSTSKGSGVLVSRQLYLWLMSCVYLFAFSSLYTQIPGLYGPNGLLPVHIVLPRQSGNLSWISCMRTFPSLVALHSNLQVSPSMMMELCCVAGSFISLLMMSFRIFRNAFSFMLLWLLYFSLFKVGQVFMWFQWDTLLLETGLLTILVASVNMQPWKREKAHAEDGISLWLVRWLLFRLMFASGVVKLSSQCPTWWNLTALNYHYQSQCIPTPLSWYAHQLPDWVQSLSVVGAFIIEIATPFLFFFPIRSLRILSFLTQVILQMLIIATGNYNFFNLLTITLCVSLIDDQFLGYGKRNIQDSCLPNIFGRNTNLIKSALTFLASVTTAGLLLALSVYYFNLRIDLNKMAVISKINFSKEDFAEVVRLAVYVAAIMGVVSLFIELGGAMLRALLQPGILQRSFSLLKVLVFGALAFLLFSISIPSIAVLDNQFYASIPPSVKHIHDSLHQFSVINSYGLFRRMTGVGGRAEIIIEGTSGDVEGGEWKEYDFLYKPGNVNSQPFFVAPHQPRLDWQMWFAALGHYKNHPWLVHLVYKLLMGEKDVLQLMDTPPFSAPPTYIRTRLYHYHFTSYNLSQSIFESGPWWQREFKSDYLYTLTSDSQQLKEFLMSQNYLRKTPVIEELESSFTYLLKYLRETTNSISPPLFLWSLFFSGLAIALSMNMLCPNREEAVEAKKSSVLKYLPDLASGDDTAIPGHKKVPNWKRSESKTAKGKTAS